MVNLMILMRVSTALSESLVSEARGKILEWLKFKEQMPFDGHIEVIFCLIYLDKTCGWKMYFVILLHSTGFGAEAEQVFYASHKSR